MEGGGGGELGEVFGEAEGCACFHYDRIRQFRGVMISMNRRNEFGDGEEIDLRMVKGISANGANAIPAVTVN